MKKTEHGLFPRCVARHDQFSGPLPPAQAVLPLTLEDWAPVFAWSEFRACEVNPPLAPMAPVAAPVDEPLTPEVSTLAALLWFVCRLAFVAGPSPVDQLPTVPEP